MSVANNDDEDNFEDTLSDILHRIDGISHFVIAHFYTFTYLDSYVSTEDPTYSELIAHWHDVFNGYNTNLQK